jgi:hypothetical protein
MRNIERSKYKPEESRSKSFQDSKENGLLRKDTIFTEVVSGRGLTKKLNELTEQEFDKLLDTLELYLKEK